MNTKKITEWLGNLPIFGVTHSNSYLELRAYENTKNLKYIAERFDVNHDINFKILYDSFSEMQGTIKFGIKSDTEKEIEVLKNDITTRINFYIKEVAKKLETDKKKRNINNIPYLEKERKQMESLIRNFPYFRFYCV